MLYEKRQEQRRGKLGLGKAVNIGFGIIVVGAGIVATPIPGPGLTLITIGLALVGSEFRITAKLLDRGEVQLRVLWKHGKRIWLPLPLPIKIILAIIASAIAVYIMYVSTKTMFT